MTGPSEVLQSDEAPEVLFHYTTQGGMLGIVRSGSLWATKIQYFNDSAEFHLTLRLAERLIAEFASKDSYAQRSETEVDALLDEIKSIEQANIFAVSLSGLDDSLSQWRSYGDPSSGFAIGLNRPSLEASANDLGWELLKCIYQSDEQRGLVGEAVHAALSADSLDTAQGVLRRQLLALAPTMKHHSFEEEDEWRLVSPLWPEQADLLVRVGRFTPVPYVPFPISEGTESAIVEVLVGPTPHRDLAIMATAAQLRLLGISARVSASGTTFREW
jgi:hypothetical protein